MAPSALLAANRNAFSKTLNNSRLKSAVELISEMMEPTNAVKLLERTRTYRGKGSRVRLGNALVEEDSQMSPESNSSQEVNIFDDTDFYQQLLRDIIDARGGRGVAAGEVRDWLIAQKQRKSKKSIDTRASKGRKLRSVKYYFVCILLVRYLIHRYEIHEKLQNFMAPMPARGAWHDEQVDELFASLLGKGVESVEMTEVRKYNSLLSSAEDGIRDGFRIFG